MFAFLFVWKYGSLSVFRSLSLFLFASSVTGGEVAEAGPAFVEFYSWDHGCV